MYLFLQEINDIKIFVKREFKKVFLQFIYLTQHTNKKILNIKRIYIRKSHKKK